MPSKTVGGLSTGFSCISTPRSSRPRSTPSSRRKPLPRGLPGRFPRYQFGPYIAYFNQGRLQDVIDLATATLYRTYKSEEAMLWRGWAYYREGNLSAAREDFLSALNVNPNYLDAPYALQHITPPP